MMGSVEVVFGEACYGIFDAFLSMPVELANGRLWHKTSVQRPASLRLELGANRTFFRAVSTDRVYECVAPGRGPESERSRYALGSLRASDDHPQHPARLGIVRHGAMQ